MNIQKTIGLLFYLTPFLAFGQMYDVNKYKLLIRDTDRPPDSLIQDCRKLCKIYAKMCHFEAAIEVAELEAYYLEHISSLAPSILAKKTEVQFNLAMMHRRLSQYGKADESIQKALRFSLASTSQDTSTVVELYFMAAQIYYLQEKYTEAEQQLENMNRLLLANISIELMVEDSIELLILKGSLQLKKGYLNLAETTFKKAAKYCLKNQKLAPLLLSQIYNNLGYLKVERNAIYTAISYFEQVLDNGCSNDLNYMANFKLIYSNLGYCYFRLNKFEQALEYHHKSTQLLAQIYPHKNEHLAFVYNHIGGSYHQLQQIDSALHYSNASIQIYETVLGKNNLALISPMRQKAKILKSTQRLDAAEKTYLRLLKIQRHHFTNKNPELASIYLDLSLLYNQKKQFRLSEIYAQKAWETNLNEKEIMHPALMIKILDHQLSLIRLLPTINDQLYFLKINKLDQIIDQSLRHIHGQTDKKLIIKSLRDLCNHSITFCYELFSKTAHQKYLAQIFELMEFNKSVLLNLSIQIQRKKPPFAQQNKQHNRLEEKWLLAWQNNDSALIYTLQKKLFDLHWKADLNPSNWLNHNRLALRDFQSILDSQATVFNYFWGEDALYLLVIEQNNVQIRSIDIAIKKQLYSFKQQFRIGQHSKHKQLISSQSYDSLANVIYKALCFDWPSDYFTVLPDRQLCDLPLAALTYQLNQNSRGYHDLHYLINKKEIGYAYSANSYYQQVQSSTNTGKNSILGLAPSYSQSSKLPPLAFAQVEINKLENNYKGVYLYDSNAHKKNFLEQCMQHSIIHLAAHGNSNINPGHKKCIYLFTKDNAAAAVLSSEDILSLTIKPQLVVLNACQTAAGIWMEGEGTMSIARDFMYAGAQSVLQTLWNVDDKSSMQISLFFYQQLAKGASKTKSLQKAQQAYLEQASSQEAHPYYWGGYQLYGKPKGIELEIGRTKKKCYLAALLIVGLCAFFISRLMYKKS